MQKNTAEEIVRTVCEAVPSLQGHTEVLTAFIDLIETVDKLPDMERRFHSEGMSLYQSISKTLTLADLENGLRVFFGAAAKPPDEEAAASVTKSATVELLGGIQTEQALFIRHAGEVEFYGALWPWQNKENVITVHLGISAHGLPAVSHQAMYDAVREYVAHKTSDSMGSGLSGQIQGISLPSFLQMSEMEGSTCTLKIRSGRKVGVMHLLEGSLIDAETQTLRHKDAAYEILCWDDTEIDILRPSGRKNNEIGLPLMHILMEALKKKDEGEYQGDTIASDTPPKSAPAKKKKKSPPKKSADRKPSVEPPVAIKKPPPKKKAAKKQLPRRAVDAVPPEPEAKEETGHPEPEPIIGSGTESGLDAPPRAEMDTVFPEPEKNKETPPPDPEPAIDAGEKSGLEMPLKKTPLRKSIADKKKGRQRVVVLAVVAVLAVCAGLYWFLLGSGGQSVEAAYTDLLNRLGGSRKLAAQEEMIHAFIRSFPKEAEYTHRAQKKLEDLRIMHEDSAYEKASRDVFKLPLGRDYREKAEGIFDQFLQQYPDSRYREEIKRTLAKFSDLTEDAYFSELSELDPRDYIKRLDAYNAYLRDYPEASHRAEVEQLVQDALNKSYKEFLRSITKCERKEDWDGCLDVCREYRDAYSSYMRMDSVDQVESRMREQKALGNLKKATKDADDETIRRLYLAFVNDYPDAAEKEKFLEEIAIIEKRLDVAKEWVELREYSRNEKIPLTERAARIRRYIDKNPSGRHMIEAENLLWQLEQPAQASGQGGKPVASVKTAQQTASTTSADQSPTDDAQQKKRLERLRKQMAAELNKTNGRFKDQGDGTVLDTVTGLVWTTLDSLQVTGGCLDHNAARQYVSGLTDGGHDDWRMPTAAELAGIYKGKPYFPGGSAEWYWSSDTYSKGYQYIANIVTTRQETEYRKKAVSVEKCGTVRAVRP